MTTEGGISKNRHNNFETGYQIEVKDNFDISFAYVCLLIMSYQPPDISVAFLNGVKF